ncbi:MAG: PilX N-terminal domain-containing pilus assembly protein [Rhodoferax sp.]|nr:PilX N-terminal domain-containing pilus assembly protein [Rhodoferax sp.]
MNRPPLASMRSQQHGVALVIALILLVVLSLLAATTLRNAASTEQVNSNVRQSLLAQQAAETALRYCEDAVVNWSSSAPVTAPLRFTTPASANPADLQASMILELVAAPISQVASNWDASSSNDYPLILPLTVVNPPGASYNTYQRPPECMIERLSPATANTYDSNFTVTARGFGPEVSAADSSRSRPIGSEVWLQSTIELN